MRKLVLFVLGFGTACAGAIYLEKWGFYLALAVVICLIGVLFGKGGKPAWRGAVVLVGCLAGFLCFFAYEKCYLREAVAAGESIREVSIQAGDYGEEGAYGTAFDGWIRLEKRTYRIRVYLTDFREIRPGDQVSGTFRLEVTVPDEVENGTYYPGKGVFLLGHSRGNVDVKPMNLDANGQILDAKRLYLDAKNLPSRLRQHIREGIAKSFPEDAAPFALAVLLGDTSGLTYGVDTALKVSGIRHVVAVSGLHVSILFTLLGAVTLRRRYVMALVGLPLLGLFAAVAGFTPSVCRACLMSGLMLLAMVTGREYDGPTALAFGVLVILLMNPLAAASVSLQLSVASVAGIFLFSPGIGKWLTARLEAGKEHPWKRRLGRFVSGSVSVSLSAMILTTPLCAWYFGSVSLVGPLTNLLTLWAVSLAFYGTVGVCLLYGVWAAGAAAAGKIVAWIIRYVLTVARVLSRVPVAAVYTCSGYITGWLVLVYGLLAVFRLGNSRQVGKLTCCAGLALCMALMASWAEPLTTQARLTVLDVGQGQCLLLQSQGKTFLVDCGGDTDREAADRAAEQLLSQGIRRLDAVIVTHLDRDHAGGVELLLSRVDTRVLVLPPEPGTPETATEAEVIYAGEELVMDWEAGQIRIFPATFPGNTNEKSLCLLFDTEKCVILITGDRDGFGERSLLRSWDIPEVDVLVAGHHGSKNATCQELLQAVKPEIVCISVGKDNAYGHPAPELLQRLEDFGCAVYRTDRQGTITIRR